MDTRRRSLLYAAPPAPTNDRWRCGSASPSVSHWRSSPDSWILRPANSQLFAPVDLANAIETVGQSRATKGTIMETQSQQRTSGTIDRVSVWTIDPAHTTIGFAVKRLMVSTVRGRFREVR